MANFFKSSNPMIRESVLKSSRQEVLDGDIVGGFDSTSVERMTVAGAVNKSFILGALLIAGAVIGFLYPTNLFLMPAAIVGFIIAIVTVFKPNLSPYTAPLYSGIEGLLIGTVSAIYASAFSGIVFQAITITMALFFLMLFLYKTKNI